MPSTWLIQLIKTFTTDTFAVAPIGKRVISNLMLGMRLAKPEDPKRMVKRRECCRSCLLSSLYKVRLVSLMTRVLVVVHERVEGCCESDW